MKSGREESSLRALFSGGKRGKQQTSGSREKECCQLGKKEKKEKRGQKAIHLFALSGGGFGCVVGDEGP